MNTLEKKKCTNIINYNWSCSPYGLFRDSSAGIL